MQVLDHHQAVEFNMMELMGIMLLGVLMEGALNPWWSNLIKERVKAAHDVSLPRVQVRVDISYCNMMQSQYLINIYVAKVCMFCLAPRVSALDQNLAILASGHSAGRMRACVVLCTHVTPDVVVLLLRSSAAPTNTTVYALLSLLGWPMTCQIAGCASQDRF
jgi:hypothetical protein